MPLLLQYTMEIQEYREKRAKYDPIAWSKCNICKEKYPNDEIVSHIHQKHPEKDCSTFSCWTCGIKFRKEAQMKRHMKTVKHELEARKFIIPDEEPVDDEVHLILTLPLLFTYIYVTFTFPMEGQFKVYLQFVHSSVLRVYIYV